MRFKHLLKANRLTEESESTLNRQRSKCMLTIPFCSRGHHLLFMSDLPYVRISAVALSSESFMVSWNIAWVLLDESPHFSQVFWAKKSWQNPWDPCSCCLKVIVNYVKSEWAHVPNLGQELSRTPRCDPALFAHLATSSSWHSQHVRVILVTITINAELLVSVCTRGSDFLPKQAA